MSTKTTLSVAIATLNEEQNIKRLLESIKKLRSEIVIIDAKSTDKTVAIARQYTDKIFFVDNAPIFHKNKQVALDKATGEWILQLDADEEVTPELRQEIISTLSTNPALNGYNIPRKNFIFGQWLKKGGLYPDYVIRLVKKSQAHFLAKNVHEQIAVSGQIGYLKNPLLHYPYSRGISQYLSKANAYTSLTADEYLKKKASKSIFSLLKHTIILPIYFFFSYYLRHGSVSEGLPGFLWAALSSSHYFFAYAKYYTSEKEL